MTAKSYTSPIRYVLQLETEGLENAMVTIIDPSSPVRSTENDPALGPTTIGGRCGTCAQTIYNCPGHRGAIKTYPVPVPLAERNLTLWLSCVCHRCGRIGLNADDRKRLKRTKGRIEFKDLHSALQAKSRDYLCPFCKAPFLSFRPVGFPTAFGYDISKPALYYVDFPGKKSETMEGRAGYHDMPIADNYYTWAILKNATAEDCELVGWSYQGYHPRLFMWDHIPIASPLARPRSSSRFSGGRTHKLYSSLCELQATIAERMGGRKIPEVQRDMGGDVSGFNALITDIFLLYYVVVSLQTRLSESLQTATAKQLKIGTRESGSSFIDMLRQKGGLLRKLVSGARHDVNIRTPLTAFTDGAIGTATCPMEFAMKICVERTVTTENIEMMRTLVRNGPNVYPGANAYKKGGRSQINFTKAEGEVIAASLVPGDVVLRHVLTGDVALHQRYPSVREESINAVMLIIDPGKLVRIPLAVCAMMMADFDGDDTELFFVSSYSVAAEALYLTSVIRKLIAPFDGRPCIGIGGDAGEDTGSGINLMRKHGKFTQAEIDALFSESFTTVEAPSGKTEYSYTDIISALLPSDFYYDAKSNGDNQGGLLLIEGGKITRGEVTPKAFEIFGANNAHLTRAIASTIDPYTAIKVLEDVTRLAYRAITKYGWSIADDMRTPDASRKKIHSLIDARVKEIDQCCNRFHAGALSIPVGQDPLDYFERVVAFNLASKNAKESFEELQTMMKGTQFEYYGYIQTFKARLPAALISLGQMLPEEHRPRPMLCYGSRHNLWFPKGYDGADAGGYIRSSFLDKLNPAEFFQASVPARGEVFKKGVGLREQGYYNRKMSTSLGPVHVGYLGEIRGHNDAILDFYYGHTGTDSHSVAVVTVDDHLIGDKEFKARHSEVKEEYDLLLSTRTSWREAIADYARVTSNEQFSPLISSFESPIDINALTLAHRPHPSESKSSSVVKGRGILTQMDEGRGTETHDIPGVSEMSSMSTEGPASPGVRVHSLNEEEDPLDALSLSEGGAASSQKWLSREEMWDVMKGFDTSLLSAHVGTGAGEFIQRIVSYKVAAFMRLFRFRCSTHILSSLGKWDEISLLSLLESIRSHYALTLVPPGDMVGLKAGLNIVAPQTQAQLHAVRGGTEIKGTVSALGRTHGTQLFREKSEGLTPKFPLSSFMLNGQLRYSLQDSLDYVKKISSVRLADVLHNSWLVSAAPEVRKELKCCGFDYLNRYLDSLPPTLKKVHEQNKHSWFLTILHLDPFRLLTNHADISSIGKRLRDQFPEAIEEAMTVYENLDGLFIFLTMKADSMELMRSSFESIIDKGVVHGNPVFSNGTIIKYQGYPRVEADGSLKDEVSYRIMLNGCDLSFLYSLPEVDKSTISTSNIRDSLSFYGIEEARFRAFEEMAYETRHMNELQGLLRRHIKVLVDYISYRGVLTFVTRTAVRSNPDIDPLDKMTFETADAFLMKAIENPKWRPIHGIMPCNLFGTSPPFGSTMSTVKFSSKDINPVVDDEVSVELKTKRVKKEKKEGGSEVQRVMALPLDSLLSTE